MNPTTGIIPTLLPMTLGLLMVALPGVARAESYGVFCANGRITIDIRSEEEMRNQRGACQFARFPDRTSAENFARGNFGGVGGACSCR